MTATASESLLQHKNFDEKRETCFRHSNRFTSYWTSIERFAEELRQFHSSYCQKATRRSILEVIVTRRDWDVHLCLGFYQLGFIVFKANFVLRNKVRFVPLSSFWLPLKKSKVVAMRTTSGISQQETFNLHSSVERSNFRLFVSFLFYFNIGFMMFHEIPNSPYCLLDSTCFFGCFTPWLRTQPSSNPRGSWPLSPFGRLGPSSKPASCRRSSEIHGLNGKHTGSRYLAVKCSKVQDELSF